MRHTFRPPAVPLVTIDPYFSVWSMNDHLYDNHTKHWTAKRHDMQERLGMTGLAVIDGKVRRFMGKVSNQEEAYEEPPPLEQINVDVQPLSSVYTFEGNGVTLTVTFTSPLLLQRLDILSRPASYVTFEVAAYDGNTHDVCIYFDITGEWCVHSTVQEVNGSRHALQDQIQVMRMWNPEQPILQRKGDHTRIDWGYVYLVVPDSSREDTVIGSVQSRKRFAERQQFNAEDDVQLPRPVEENTPVMAAKLDFGTIASEPVARFVVLAYDDISSVEYFHEPLAGYWRKFHATADGMIQAAVDDYEQVMRECTQFNQQLLNDARDAGGPHYADILSLAYRQAIAAHKLVEDKDGKLLFLSKECDSNGCMATVDVSYPSIPLFLLYNSELVKGMLRPIFRYASSEQWPYEFAPHDVGRYPVANGQAYGMDIERQMPVEECGNMLIMTTAVCLAEGKSDFAEEHWQPLSQWATYLTENGLDPGNQLCTDDFAGHLARNANLSIKAIMAIASYGILSGMAGNKEKKQQYIDIAKQMASEWEKLADDGHHYRLTFDGSGTWSLKYNLIWDQIFQLDIFPQELIQKEVKHYLLRQNRYGTPLDNRHTYTKADWLVWAASLADSQEDFEALIQPLWSFLHESKSRVPFSDWYYTMDGLSVAMVNRSVVGGTFIKLLKEKGLQKK